MTKGQSVCIINAAADEDMEKAYQLAKDNKLLSDENHFNLKYSLAEYFIKRAAEDGNKLTISINMYAYDCYDPVEPTIKAAYALYERRLRGFKCML